jgi:NTP pyrophosphatase (non-canonical NTP hydrolase)
MALTFGGYQRWFQEYDEARGFTEVDVSASAMHLMEEVGEIARHLLRLEGYRMLSQDERAAEIEALALELSDAFVFLTKIANKYDIDWEETIGRAMEKAEARYSVEEGQRLTRQIREARASDEPPR